MHVEKKMRKVWNRWRVLTGAMRGKKILTKLNIFYLGQQKNKTKDFNQKLYMTTTRRLKREDWCHRHAYPEIHLPMQSVRGQDQ